MKPQDRMAKARAAKAAKIAERKAAAAAAASAAAPRGRPKLKPKPDWTYDNRLEKFRAGKGLDPQDYEGEDRLAIPQDILDDLQRNGVTVQWVAEQCLGMELDYEVSKHVRNGWQRVAPGDIPGIDVTEIGGLALYARSSEIDKKARARDHRKAIERVRANEHSLKDGVLSPTVTLDSRHPSALRSNRINKTYEPLSVPRED